MRRRIAAQLVLVVAGVVGIAFATGAIGTDTSSDDPSPATRSIDLIEATTIEIDLAPEWTLIESRYIESTTIELEGFCPAVGVDLAGPFTVWGYDDARLSVLLVGSDWRAPDLEADIAQAVCTPTLTVFRHENIVGVLWFEGEPDGGAADRALGAIRTAVRGATPYLEDQYAPEPPDRFPKSSTAAVLVVDDLCLNAGTIEAFGVSWPTDDQRILPESWREAGRVEGTLTVEGLDGSFVGPDGHEVRVTRDFREPHCLIG